MSNGHFGPVCALWRLKTPSNPHRVRRALEHDTPAAPDAPRSKREIGDDLWNTAYLRGMKWNELTQELADERAEREARLRREMREARMDADEYVGRVEEAESADRRAKKQGRAPKAKSLAAKNLKRVRQRKVVEASSRAVGDDVLAALGGLEVRVPDAMKHTCGAECDSFR